MVEERSSWNNLYINANKYLCVTCILCSSKWGKFKSKMWHYCCRPTLEQQHPATSLHPLKHSPVFIKGTNGVPMLLHLVNLHQLDVNFWKINVFWASNKQTTYRNWLFYFWRLRLKSPILEVWCDEDVMIHYNNDNNAYCRAVNAHNCETIKHNTV